MGLGDLFPSGIGGMSGGSIMTLVWVIAIALISITAIGFMIWWVRKQKKWNLKVEFKLIRSDGKLIDAEWGKGCFDGTRGAVFIQRKGMKPCPMKPFDIKRFIQGRSNILTVEQIGVKDYRPVLPESFTLMVDDKTKEEASIMNMRIDTSESQAWRNSFERDAKSTYSIVSILREFAPFIGIALVIFLWGIQLMIVLTKLR